MKATHSSGCAVHRRDTVMRAWQDESGRGICERGRGCGGRRCWLVAELLARPACSGSCRQAGATNCGARRSPRSSVPSGCAATRAAEERAVGPDRPSCQFTFAERLTGRVTIPACGRVFLRWFARVAASQRWPSQPSHICRPPRPGEQRSVTTIVANTETTRCSHCRVRCREALDDPRDSDAG